MNKRKFFRSVLATGAAVAVAVGLTGPAYAHHGSWDIDDPSTESVNETVVSITATGTGALLTNNGAELECEEAVAYGDAFDDLHDPNSSVSPHNDPDHVADIDQVDWIDCEGPFGIDFEVTHEGTWLLYADEVVDDKDTPSDPTDDVVAGRLTDVTAHIEGLLCEATVTGEVRGTYDNETGILTIDEPEDSGNLVVSNASCLGLLNNGNSPGFQIVFTTFVRFKPVAPIVYKEED